MKTIKQAFEDFLQKLELTSNERNNASRQHINMRTELQQRLGVEDNFLSGSYARHTAIRPLNDIDIFVVLEENDDIDRELGPASLLETVETTLQEIYPGKATTRQSRSINIEFSGTGIAYDVVPSFSDGEGVYIIPDGDAGWMQTNPKDHKTKSTAANEAAGKKLKPLLKAVKHSKNVHDSEARSFHLEVLSWEVLSSEPDSYIDGLVQLLEGLAAKVCDPCPDPAGLGDDIRPSMVRCLSAQTWLNEMATLARDARQLALDGKLGDAHSKMREIFGSEWPEKGSSGNKGGAGGAIISGGGVDDSRYKFG